MRSPRGWARAAAMVLCIALAAVPWWLAVDKPDHADFDQYWYGGFVERSGTYTDTSELLRRADADGAHPTRDDVYGPPTLIALVFVPLSLLRLDTAVSAFLVGSFGLLLYAMRRAAPPPCPAWFLGVCLLPGTLFALALGQASLVTFGLLLLAYAWARDGGDVRVGAMVGLAAAWKVYPAFVLVAFVAHRRWRAMASGRMEWLTQAATVLVPSIGAVALMLRRCRALHHTVALAVVLALLVQSITWSHYVPAAVIALLVLVEARPASRLPAAAAIAGTVLMAWPRDLALIPERKGVAGLTTAQDTLALVLLAAAILAALPASHRLGQERTHVQPASEPVR